MSPKYAPLLAGAGAADSWAIDCHKWLNVPYDSAVAIVRAPEHLQAAMAMTAAYLTPGAGREPWHFAPEASRRARVQYVAEAELELDVLLSERRLEASCPRSRRHCYI